MDDVIRFRLDGAPHEIRDLDPNTTVLEWLRGDGGRRGSKEGCAEGDCGACTVAIAGPAGRWRAVNACIQPIATLDGMALRSVESLRGAGGALHPVQQALVECHGSQCGFCTPGFVMSLHALLQQDPRPDDEAILRALAGNLCRCTGYRPILAAARRLRDRPLATTDRDHAEPADPARTTGLCYAAAGRRWFAPRSLAELDAALAQAPEARLVAGATDLGLEITKQHRRFPAMIALGGIDALNGIAEDADRLDIGAAVTWAEAHPLLTAYWPELDTLIARFAGLQIRNVATLGGNLANASPIGDGAPMLLALDASLELWRGGVRRHLKLSDFFRAYRCTALAPGEIIARIHVPKPGPDTHVAAYKVAKRQDSDISAVCAVFALDCDGERRIRACRIAYGGMAAVPLRLPKIEAHALGRIWDTALDAEMERALAAAMQPIDDLRASAAYRRHVAASLWRRFAAELRDGAPRAETRIHG
jgi:xanthine dehydrogenase small subunit